MQQTRTATLLGIQAREVSVEISLSPGLPGFSIVGLPGPVIVESRDRIKAALQHNGFKFPPKKIIVNLSPSEIEKSGTHFDLPIALGLMFYDDLQLPENTFVFGELGLDGQIKDTPSIFPLLLSLAQTHSDLQAWIPAESVTKISLIPGLKLQPFQNIQEIKEYFQNPEGRKESAACTLERPLWNLDGTDYFCPDGFQEDFRDVKGQELAIRAALIAAAGFHNVLMEGSPGSGKSMIIKRLRSILPPLSHTEMLEVANIQSLDKKEPDFLSVRPIRAPHHTATRASIFGGGSKDSKPGEVSLAHLGILFFDELPHFPKMVLEALREPMQENRLLISRVNQKVEYPSKFLFAGAMNPCPCGNLLSESQECRCTELEVQRYRNRLSDPFLDRIDLFVQMRESRPDDRPTTDSKQLFDQVKSAFAMQKKRGQQEFNGKLSDAELNEYCPLKKEAEEVLHQAGMRFGLSQRSLQKLKKVARTIADLDSSEAITKKAMLEAVSFRRR